MKKATYIIALALALTLSACAGSVHNNEKFFPSDYMMGIIESTGQVNKSVINLYDTALQPVGKVRFNLGSMGTSFDPPQTVNGKVYTIPQGIGNMKEKEIALEMDLKTGKSREIKTGLGAVYSFTVTDEYIFASSTINAETVISRVSLKDGEIKKVSLPKMDFVDQLNTVGDKVLAFGNYMHDNKMSAVLLIYDIKKMRQVERHDITKFGISHSGSIRTGNSVYFSSCSKLVGDEEEIPDNRLIKYDATTGKFTEFALDEKEPATMVSDQEKLYILHSDLVVSESHGVTVFDLRSETFVYHPLKELRIKQISVRNGRMYALSNTTLYQYRITDKGFELEGQKEIRTMTSDYPHYFTSGMFFNSTDEKK